MCKKSYVWLAKGKKKYKLCSEDIVEVHKIIQKKRPNIPKFECMTEDTILSEEKQTQNS